MLRGGRPGFKVAISNNTMLNIANKYIATPKRPKFPDWYDGIIVNPIDSAFAIMNKKTVYL